MNTALGTHIIIDLFDCNTLLLDDVSMIELFMLEASKKAHATIIDSTFHHFSPYGVSGVVVIQESHIAIHTWPEYGFATVDIFTCGNEIDATIAKENLVNSLEAKSANEQLGKRGIGIKRTSKSSSKPEKTTAINRSTWFTDRSKDFALSLKYETPRLFWADSPQGKVEVYDTHTLGKILVSDQKILISTHEERAYHEMMVHVPILTQENTKQVLIIGGGDGGLATEVLLHDSIKKIDIIEYNTQVVKATKAHFPRISSAFSNSKVQLHISDAKEFLSTSSNIYDLVLLDIDLYDISMLDLIKENSNHESAIVIHLPSPQIEQESFIQTLNLIYNKFGAINVHLYTASIAMSATGMTCFAIISKVSPTTILKSKRSFLEKNERHYYNKEIHQASFVLPQFLKKICNNIS